MSDAQEREMRERQAAHDRVLRTAEACADAFKDFATVLSQKVNEALGIARESLRPIVERDVYEQALKPCPLCGNAVERPTAYVMEGRTLFFVECQHKGAVDSARWCCVSSPSFDAPSEAIAAWNHRPAEDELARRIDELTAERDAARKDVVGLRNLGLGIIDGANAMEEQLTADLAAARADARRWIPTAERLPELSTRVLMSRETAGYFRWVTVGYRTDGDLWYDVTAVERNVSIETTPLAWQPLPEPYTTTKEGSDEV